MKILIAGLVKNEQLIRLKQEGSKRGHEVEGSYTSELVIEAGNESFEPTLRGRPMAEYDLIYNWAVGKRRWEWYAAELFLKEKYATIIVNSKVVDPSYKLFLTPAMNYLKQYRQKLPFPKSVLIFSSKSIDSIIDKFKFPLIVKTSAGRQGRGVFKADSKEELVEKVSELQGTKQSVVIREFILNDGDIRVFCVGYHAIGAMRRIPKEGEFRSNISLGGKGEKFDLERYPKVKRLAEKVAKVTATEIAGVDIIIHQETGKSYILEVNPGPQFAGLEKYTKTNAALEIIKYFESLLV